MSFFAALFDALVILEGACVVVGGVKSRVKRSFWAVGGGGAADNGTDLTGFEVAGGVNVSADRSVRCVRRAWAAVFVGGALTTGTAGVAGVGACTAGGAGAAASCRDDQRMSMKRKRFKEKRRRDIAYRDFSCIAIENRRVGRRRSIHRPSTRFIF